MTIDEFFDYIKNIKFKLMDGKVRAVKRRARTGVCACPIVAAANKMGKKRLYGNSEVLNPVLAGYKPPAYTYIGLSPDDARDIVAAADGCQATYRIREIAKRFNCT
jgi:hypothetical protein